MNDIKMIEQEIIAMFNEILGLEEPCSKSDSFISLGGQSIGAMQLQLKIMQKFQVKVSFAQLFEVNTPEDLAMYIEANLKE